MIHKMLGSISLRAEHTQSIDSLFGRDLEHKIYLLKIPGFYAEIKMIEQDKPLTISIDEAATVLRIGRDAVKSGMRLGEIPYIQAGKLPRICVPALESKLRGETQPNESEIARQMHLLSLKSSLQLLDLQRAELARQIAEIENVDNTLVAYIEAARQRRRSA